MRYAINDLDLIYKIISESELIEKFIFDTYGLKGGQLVINDNNEVKLHVISTDTSFVNVIATLWIPFELVVKYQDRITLFTVNKNKVDLIMFSINLEYIDHTLSDLINKNINNED